MKKTVLGRGRQGECPDELRGNHQSDRFGRFSPCQKTGSLL